MAEEKSIGGKDLGRFCFYMAIVALCIAAVLYMLLNAKPQVNPKLEHPGSPSMLVQPDSDAPPPVSTAGIAGAATRRLS